MATAHIAAHWKRLRRLFFTLLNSLDVPKTFISKRLTPQYKTQNALQTRRLQGIFTIYTVFLHLDKILDNLFKILDNPNSNTEGSLFQVY